MVPARSRPPDSPVLSAASGSVSQLPGATRTERKIPEHGVRKLRQREAQALIGIGIDALSHAYQVGSEVLAAIYDKEASLPDPALQDRIAEVLTCMETAEHYLLMLGCVIEDRPAPHGIGETGFSTTQ